jgi:hypothetical protein
LVAERGVTAAFIAKGLPQQNCYVERFDGTGREELLSCEPFTTRARGRQRITAGPRTTAMISRAPKVELGDFLPMLVNIRWPSASELRAEASSTNAPDRSANRRNAAGDTLFWHRPQSL